MNGILPTELYQKIIDFELWNKLSLRLVSKDFNTIIENGESKEVVRFIKTITNPPDYTHNKVPYIYFRNGTCSFLSYNWMTYNSKTKTFHTIMDSNIIQEFTVNDVDFKLFRNNYSNFYVTINGVPTNSHPYGVAYPYMFIKNNTLYVISDIVYRYNNGGEWIKDNNWIIDEYYDCHIRPNYIFKYKDKGNIIICNNKNQTLGSIKVPSNAKIGYGYDYFVMDNKFWNFP